MKNNIKNIIVVVTFFLFIIGAFLVNLIKADAEVSISERRKLAAMPKLTFESVKNTEFMSDFEEYSLDNFLFRDEFRKLKAFVHFNIFSQNDNNDIYIADGQATKLEEKLNEKDIVSAAKKFNKLKTDFLKEMNVYYTVIPDKGYYIAEQNGYPHYDYEKLVTLLEENISGMEYIDIFDCLTKDDYYSTDIHWRQEKLDKVVNRIMSKFGIEVNAEYEEKKLEPFYGVYYGQSALPLNADDIVYLTNDEIENATVKILDEKTLKMVDSTVYVEEKFEGNDPYDVFLSGPIPLVTIKNENADTDRELIIFRDSFGSSIAPLLVSSYKKITLIDVRYIATPMLKEYVEFNSGADALIIYSTSVLNNSAILKVF